MRDVVIAGSTGSIGTQAIEVITDNPQRFRVVGLAAGGSNLELLIAQAKLLAPKCVAVFDTEQRDILKAALPGVEILVGAAGVEQLAAAECDVVLNGITGAAGLLPTLAALTAGRTLALANKESLVIGGALVTKAAAPGQIVPVDSEHSALAQALRAGSAAEVRKLILTASGGPFRGMNSSALAAVTPAQALAHPTWKMGRVVTINSATLVNKGLELIEAGLLFNVDFDDIEVVVHPESIVHSMVEFHDGSTLAQCSPPDMKLPIALALGWPERVAGAGAGIDWSGASTWNFEPLDNKTFPAVELARMVGKQGGCFPAIYNGANEVAVDAFCNQQLAFTGIVAVVEAALEKAFQDRWDALGEPTLSDVLAADEWARSFARVLVKES
ncbi:MAG: 1-deoxy-D-xylulose-5-phosphate reductoisomerase [Propionibacteriaceae bacterium]|nr:1-deoxy-D-xylulose-5-phosphate reductoisomerase [Propionibacteriaceae bacterium]